MDAQAYYRSLRVLLVLSIVFTTALGFAPNLANGQASASQAILLDFHADWCGPCRAMQPAVAKLAAAGYSVRPVNFDQEPDLAAKFGVSSIPCFVVVVDGRERGRITGMSSYDQLAAMMAKAGMRPSNGAIAAPAAPRTTASANPDSAVRKNPHSKKAPDTAALENRLLAASVRLRVDDGDAYSYGSGTIIDQRRHAHGSSGEALILTCAHVFRESKGKGTIRVERFVGGVAQSYEGRLVRYDLTRDVALVTIRTQEPVATAPLAGPKYQSRQGDQVISIGCDNGSEPAIRHTKVTAINSFIGPQNLQIADMPAVGRSGGGLFNERGEVVGVCNMADIQQQAGLFADISLAHQLLDASGLAVISRRSSGTALASSTTPAAARRQRVAAPAPKTTSAGTGDSAAVEVICIVRGGRGEKARSTTFIISGPSQDLLTRLAAEQRQTPATSPTGMSQSK